MMGVVTIKGLEPEAVIGCYDWEREIKQRLIIDLAMTTDFTAAAKSDDLPDALDYAAISQQVISFVEQTEFQLLEALSAAIATEIFQSWPVSALRIDIDKPNAVPEAASVGVSLNVSRAQCLRD
jgi:dihydroneopterin aldolase